VAGVISLFQTPQYQQTVDWRDFRPHPQYNRDTLINDIALIFLRRRISFNNVMQPIALPPRSHVNNRFIGDAATIFGWGRWGNDRKYSKNFQS
jgi:hypothetical protein